MLWMMPHLFPSRYGSFGPSSSNRMLIPHNRFVNVAFCLMLMAMAAPLEAQPDLTGWTGIVRSMQHATWVEDLEQLEPGSVLEGMEPSINPNRFRMRTVWADELVRQLESLPHGEHHADRALERLLADSMLCFRLMETAAERDGSHLNEESLERLEERWQAAKRELASSASAPD